MSTVHLAVDLGATSGRVIAGVFDGESLELEELVRFPNHPVMVPTALGPRLQWDILTCWNAVLEALRIADAKYSSVASISVDSWAVDYGLLDSDDVLISNPASYRCNRTDDMPAKLWQRMPHREHYGFTGIQFQKFNTIFQLLAEANRSSFGSARTALMIPDLLTYWLSGKRITEVTNASSTGLLSPRTRTWSPEVTEVVHSMTGRDLQQLFPSLVEPGTVVGETLPEHGVSPVKVVAVGSHDTASAVVAIPTQEAQPYYVSCGTWSLVGTEVDEANTSDQARQWNFTNELGVGRKVRLLKNVMGLWVLNESMREWELTGEWTEGVEKLVAEAAELANGPVIDINHDSLFAPGDMPSRVRELADAPLPTPAHVARCIIDSLAQAYRRAIDEAAQLTGTPVRTLHMVGGGIQNELLCQLTADAVGVPVVAGPVEGTALGNLVVQLMALGEIPPDLAAARKVIAASTTVKTYKPQGANS